jgi:hypothetical protein
MKHRLVAIEDDGAIVTLRVDGLLRPGKRETALRFTTRTGALLRLDGVVRGAFDPKHDTIALALPPASELTLEVERSSLPTTGLPSATGPSGARCSRACERRLPQ